MEEGKKKMIMVAIIVVCIVVAVIVTLATRTGPSGGIDSIPEGQMIWLICREPNCGNTWQMDLREYHQYLDKYRDGMIAPGVICPKCGEKSGYRAIKCEKCGNVFEKVAALDDFSDRCPKCGYSATEESRK
jgi:predicted RNA-binding Zn-ribbon protein involved in translation (DUF1610 family)